MKQNQIINKPFHSKYRPYNLNTLLSQDHVISYFKVALTNKRLSFAYLFVGNICDPFHVKRRLNSPFRCPPVLWALVQA